MRYSQWRAFDAVARSGSVSRAAAMLGITQPGVSLQIKALETSCAMSLFRRQGRLIVLTDAGRTLLGMTRRMFAIEDEMREFISSTTALRGGTLVLAADGPHVALELVSRFRKHHGQIDIKMSFGNSGTVWKELVEQRVDAAIIANPPRDQAITIVPLARKNMVVLMPPHHRLATRRSIKLKELEDEQLIMREPGSNTRRIIQNALRQSKLHPRSTLEIGSREAVREAVAMELGVGFAFEREIGQDARIVAVQISGLEASNLDTLAYRRSDRERVLIKAVSKVAEEMSSDASAQ